MSGARRGTGSATPSERAAAGEPPLPALDPVTDYEKIRRIGEGTFGVVYKARDRRTGEIVALKKLRMDRERDGMPVTSVRELRVLQTCKHPNLVELKRVVTGSKLDSVFLVFEYCEHDLGRLVDTMPHPFHESEVKCLMRQLLEALVYLHDRWVMHRDIKMSNLLFTNRGQLKLCDFGLARWFKPWEEGYTPGVVTLWYRAPEVLLGAESYTEAVDIWGAGCVFGELLLNEPLFPGRTEAGMLDLIARLLGSPSERIWPGLAALPGGGSLRPTQPYNYLRQRFPRLSDEGLDLLNRLLTYDPERRLTARQALRHAYFSERPMPRQPAFMPTFPSAHDAEPGGGGGGGGGRLQQRRAAEEAHGAGVKRRYLEQDRFGGAFGDARAAKRPQLATNTTMSKPIVPLQKWNAGICSCGDSCGICCYGFWCPFCLFGENAHKATGESCATNCFLSCVLSYFGCYCCYAAPKRKRIRDMYQLEEKPCGDCCTHCWCAPCAICQEAAELKHRGTVAGGQFVTTPPPQAYPPPPPQVYPPPPQAPPAYA